MPSSRRAAPGHRSDRRSGAPEPTAADPVAPGQPVAAPVFGRRHALGLLATAGISVTAATLARARRVNGMAAPRRPGGGSTAPTSTAPTTAPTGIQASSPTPDGPTDGPTDPSLAALGRVVVLGDSITFISTDTIQTALAGIDPLTVDGRFGFTIGQLLPDARRFALTDPDVVVVNLGTNDARNGLATSESVARFDELLALFPQAAHVLTTVNTHFGPPSCVERARAINDHLRPRATSLVDWDQAVADELAAGFPDGPITTDTIHPTMLGQQILSGLIVRALASIAPA